MNASPLLLLKPEKRQFRTLGGDAARFIETFCILGAGDSYGDPFVLRPWQKQILNRMLEIVYDPRSKRWRRRYSRALLGLPSGSGKTPFAAAIGMWFLCSDQHRSPSVACSAASKEQSGLVFGNARIMAEGDRLRKFLETGRDSITVKGGPGRLYRVSAAEGTNDGQIISCLIKDEYHEWSDTRNTDAILTKATTKIADAFQLAITTAGYDLDTICGKLYTHGKAIQRGEEVDDRFFFHWVEADEDADPDDEETWQKVHPAVGDFISIDAIRDKRRELSTFSFRRYYYNQWTEAPDSWLEAGVWDSCEVIAEDAAFDPELPVFVGWDGSRKRDSTAVVAVQKAFAPQRNEAGEVVTEPDSDEPVLLPRVKVLPRTWDRPRISTGAFDEDWRVDQKEVMDYIRELSARYNVVRVPFDPALIALYADELLDEAIPMIEFPQSPARMTEATGILEGLITDGTIAHDGDPKLARHIGNAVYEPMRTGGGRLIKGRAKNPMDGAIALAMAAWAMTKWEEEAGPPDIESMLYV